MPDRRAGLSRDLLTRLDKVLLAMAAIDHPMVIAQGVRTAEAQHNLYRQGRDLPGAIVTNADGYLKKSNHQAGADGLGHAVDCMFVKGEAWGGGQPWILYGMLGEAVGLRWGGRWKQPYDRPHLELV